MKNLAIIPARGGSRRIPRKNIRPFLGKPIIAYTIESAIASGMFDEVMVSTDDAEISEISKKYGAKVPFLRTENTANDFATLADVISEVLSSYDSLGRKFENVCCLLPTAPFVTADDIAAGYKMLGTHDAVIPVVAFSYPIMRSLSIDSQGTLKMNWPEYATTRSQDIPPAYHDSGTFYWIKADAFTTERTIFVRNCTGMPVDEMRAQDIDTETDWQLAELKYRLLYPEK